MLSDTMIYKKNQITTSTHLVAGTRIRQVLIVINIYISPQRTYKSKSAKKNVSFSIWGGVPIGS